jgi:uncharacterized spore protein YtfJ
MDDSLGDSVRKARDAASDDRLQALAAKVGADAGAKAVFGKPVEREGITVIPVARVRWGFGGGYGQGDDNSHGSGSGGGGGVQASPVGFIEIHDGTAEYKSVRDPMRMAAAWTVLPVSAAVAAGVTVLSVWLAARSVRNMMSLRRRPAPVQFPRLSNIPRPHLADIPHPHVSDIPRPNIAAIPRPHLSDIPHPHIPDLPRPLRRAA